MVLTQRDPIKCQFIEGLNKFMLEAFITVIEHIPSLDEKDTVYLLPLSHGKQHGCLPLL